MTELPTKKILIIDDDEVLRASLARALTRYGFELFQADSVDATKSILSKHSVDSVVLADLQMLE